MKNTLKAITLAAVLTFGATFANAGLLVSDRPSQTGDTTCNNTDTSVTGIIIGGVTGIIIGGIAGIIIGGDPGIIIGGRSEQPCQNNTFHSPDRSQSSNGLLVSD